MISSIFVLGLSSSFLGALPLGMLNITVLKLSLEGKIRAAFGFALGAICIEFFQIAITLFAMQKLLTIPFFATLLTIISIPILLFLGFQSFKTPPPSINAPKMAGEAAFQHHFLTGIKLSAANVLIYPFWLLWGNIFLQNGWFYAQASHFLTFSLGASLGTLGAFAVFIVLGKLISPYLSRFQHIFGAVVGVAFIGFAFLQCFKLFQ
ncbi:MAG: hypothetical protein RL757_74 [Bacteroidota bacterium]|jgi:threonine/homoserine/homoserine lactone efflux protein